MKTLAAERCSHLVVAKAASAIELYVSACGAKELFRLVDPKNKLGHCEMQRRMNAASVSRT
jgi:hypothetical protein